MVGDFVTTPGVAAAFWSPVWADSEQGNSRAVDACVNTRGVRAMSCQHLPKSVSARNHKINRDLSTVSPLSPRESIDALNNAPKREREREYIYVCVDNVDKCISPAIFKAQTLSTLVNAC